MGVDAPAPFCLLSLDVSDFSRLQARLGHKACLNLMQMLCNALRDALGARGRVIAVGEGRFGAVVAKIFNSGHAMLAAEKLARTADGLFGQVDLAIKPRVFIGVAIGTGNGLLAEELLQKSQIAAEAARARSERVVVYDSSCDREVLLSWSLGNDFARALDGGELSVHYQPKIDVDSGIPSGAEALMRWERDGKPVATPDVFIPLATEAGLMQQLTWYSLSNALRASVAADIPIAVNISAEILHHREFLDMMHTAITTWNPGKHAATVEITEGALVTDFEEAMQRLNRLRDMGIRVSIDDFGTGYSSLGYFKKIPADELKVDKSFVRNLVGDPDDRRLVKTIIELARHFRMQVVAEGVEDWQTFDTLADLGCDCIQGFLFARAMSLERLQDWLTHNRRDLRVDRTAAEMQPPRTAVVSAAEVQALAR